MSSEGVPLENPIPVQMELRRLWRQSFASLWRRIFSRVRGAPKQLHLRESLSLGDRRFVAVIEFEGKRFLVGGTSASLSLLARLGEESEPGCGRVRDCRAERTEL